MWEQRDGLWASSSVSAILSSVTTPLPVPMLVTFVSCRHALNGSALSDTIFSFCFFLKHSAHFQPVEGCNGNLKISGTSLSGFLSDREEEPPHNWKSYVYEKQKLRISRARGQKTLCRAWPRLTATDRKTSTRFQGLRLITWVTAVYIVDCRNSWLWLP